MPINKCPFLINQDLLPLKLCAELVDKAYIKEDSFYSQPLNNAAVNSVIDKLNTQINSYFDTSIKGYLTYSETYDAGITEPHRCDNSVFSNGNWYRNKDIDFTTIIFLKDYNTKAPIDENTEVFGAKLEFPTFNFGFNPEAGTAITYPAYPNFLNVFTATKIGLNHILRISHEADTMFLYDHTKFPGRVRDWFSDLT